MSVELEKIIWSNSLLDTVQLNPTSTAAQKQEKV
jgi:hypothetical protein